MTESNPTPPVDPVPPPPINYASPVSGTSIFAPPPAPLEAVTDADSKLWGMLCHLSALIQFFGIPSFLGPLVIWLIKKDQLPFVKDQGKEALNFHITVIIVALVLSPTVCLAGLGIILLAAVGIAALVMSIIGGVKANSGIWYRYPFAIRLIK